METNINNLTIEDLLNILRDRFCRIPDCDYSKNIENYKAWREAENYLDKLDRTACKFNIINNKS